MRLEKVIGLYYFIFFALIGDYVIAIPKSLMDDGFSSWEIGLVFASLPIARFLFPFIYLKRAITQKDYLLALVVPALSSLLLLSENFYLIMLSLFLIGGGFSIVFPYIEAMAIDRMKENYGKARLFGSVGFMFVGALYALVYIDPIWLFISLVFLLSFIGFYFINGTYLASNNEMLDFKSYWWFWVMLMLVEISFGGYYDFFTIYNINHGLSKETIGWIWTIGTLAEIIIFSIQYKFIERFPPMFWVKFSVAITSFRWLLLYLFAGNLEVVIIVQVLQAVSFAIFHTANLLFINMIYKNKTLAQQFYAGIAYGLAEFTGSVLAGFMYGEYLFLYEALFVLLGYLVLLYGTSYSKTNIEC